jgi:hypothetical protein
VAKIKTKTATVYDATTLYWNPANIIFVKDGYLTSSTGSLPELLLPGKIKKKELGMLDMPVLELLDFPFTEISLNGDMLDYVSDVLNPLKSVLEKRRTETKFSYADISAIFSVLDTLNRSAELSITTKGSEGFQVIFPESSPTNGERLRFGMRYSEFRSQEIWLGAGNIANFIWQNPLAQQTGTVMENVLQIIDQFVVEAGNPTTEAGGKLAEKLTKLFTDRGISYPDTRANSVAYVSERALGANLNIYSDLIYKLMYNFSFLAGQGKEEPSPEEQATLFLEFSNIRVREVGFGLALGWGDKLSIGLEPKMVEILTNLEVNDLLTLGTEAAGYATGYYSSWYGKWESRSHPGLDAGITYKPSENFTMALSIKDLFPQLYILYATRGIGFDEEGNLIDEELPEGEEDYYKWKVGPQFRLGFGLDLSKSVTVALDHDINKVKTSPWDTYSQWISGAVSINATNWFRINAGIGQDLRVDNSARYGLGFDIVSSQVKFGIGLNVRKEELTIPGTKKVKDIPFSAAGVAIGLEVNF